MNNNHTWNSVVQQTAHSQYPVSMAMNSDFSIEQPQYSDAPVFHQQHHGMPRQINASSPNIA